MIDKTTFWIVLPALALGTYAIRFSFLGTLGARPLPLWLTRALRYTAVAVLPAHWVCRWALREQTQVR